MVLLGPSGSARTDSAPLRWHRRIGSVGTRYRAALKLPRLFRPGKYETMASRSGLSMET